MGRARRLLLAAGALLVARGARRVGRRIVPVERPERGAERAVLVLLALTTLSALAFPVIYGLHGVPHRTQLLGAALGLAFLLAGAALIVTGKRLVVNETLEEDYPEPEHREQQDELVRLVHESGDKMSRKRLLGLGATAAAGALGLAVLTPVVSLGPAFDWSPFVRTPWRRGRRLVDESGRPLLAAEIEEGTFYTALPEGANREDIAAPVVLVRMPPGALDLPPELRGYDAGGILAFSKICTHAGCAVSLYRTPLFAPTSPKPALICPCHYSTFDPARGGTVEFGPAGRPLPMLPLQVDGAGALRAAGNFNEPPGPSWWAVRKRAARS
jgi:ubiquinol-cytochrome c reductase iron-sulfur subunit